MSIAHSRLHTTFTNRYVRVKASHRDGELGAVGLINGLCTVERDVDENRGVEVLSDEVHMVRQVSLVPLAAGKSTAQRSEAIQEEALAASRQRVSGDEGGSLSRVPVCTIIRHESLHDEVQQTIRSLASIYWHSELRSVHREFQAGLRGFRGKISQLVLENLLLEKL